LPLLSHNIEDENPLLILTIKNTTRWNYYLSVYGIGEFGRYPPGLSKVFQTLGLIKNLLNETDCGRRIVKSNVLSDGI